MNNYQFFTSQYANNKKIIEDICGLKLDMHMSLGRLGYSIYVGGDYSTTLKLHAIEDRRLELGAISISRDIENEHQKEFLLQDVEEIFKIYEILKQNMKDINKAICQD